MRTRIAVMSAVVLLASALATAKAAQTRASPHETISAGVRGAELSITYGRPSMRGRTIMGALVPYGRVWCPGADEATTLTTTKPLKMGDLTLAAGRYTLWMLPTADAWTLVVNKQTGQWHTQYDPAQDLGPRRAAEARADGARRAADVRDREGRVADRRRDHDDVGDDRGVGAVHRSTMTFRNQRACSSVVEHSTFNRMVVGSIPTRRTTRHRGECRCV